MMSLASNLPAKLECSLISTDGSKQAAIEANLNGRLMECGVKCTTAPTPRQADMAPLKFP